MQDLHDGDNEDAAATPVGDTGRILEDSRALISGPRGELFRIGPHRSQPLRKKIDGLDWFHVQLEYLEWRPQVTRALLEGAALTNLLPVGYILLDGKHRPAWHPRPGVDDVDLAFFPWPPEDFAPIQFMVKLGGLIRRS